MKEFVRRLPLEAALEWVDSVALRPCLPEEIPLRDAFGWVLAADVRAEQAMPAQATALADGYALSAGDTLGASSYNPLPLAFTGVRPAIAICSGQTLPMHADAVLPCKSVQGTGALLEILEPVARGAGILEAGAAMQAGERLLAAGRRLLAPDLALLAMAGFSQVKVWPRPVVSLHICGAKANGEEALAVALGALLARDGGVVRTDAGQTADLHLFAGRSGVGEDDDAAVRITALGGTLHHHGLALEPGRTSGLGVLDGAPLVLLPGEPFRALVVYEVLAGQLLRRLAGVPSAWLGQLVTLPLRRKIASPVGTSEWVPVRIVQGEADPIAVSAANGLAALSAMDGFLIVPAGSEGFAEGQRAEIVLISRLG